MSNTKASSSVINLTSPGVNAVVLGGSIDGTPIGATTPSTGKFSTLQTTGNATLPLINNYNGTRPWVKLLDLRSNGTTGGSAGRAPSGTMYSGPVVRSIGFGGWTPTGSYAQSCDPFGLYSGGTVVLNVTPYSPAGSYTSTYFTTATGYIYGTASPSTPIQDLNWYTITITQAGLYHFLVDGTGCVSNRSCTLVYQNVNPALTPSAAFALQGTNANGSPAGNIGAGESNPSGGARVFDQSVVDGVINVAANDVFYIATWSNATGTVITTGTGAGTYEDRSAFGSPDTTGSWSNNEIYLSCKITKLT